MRSMRCTASRALRTARRQQSSASTFRLRQRVAPCVLCAQGTPAQISPQRHQSGAAVPNAKEGPSSAQSPAQHAASQTHYSFFPKALPSGPPPHAPFTIDLRALKREFLQLQARAHPDMHPQANKKRAEALSARINEAYKTLQNPLLRAQYLLSLRGIEVAEDETAKVEDPELLMEVLEAREQIEEAEQEEDLEGTKTINKERIRASEETLEQAFKDDNVELAKSEAIKLRYWINIRDSIDGWEKGKPVVLQH